MIKGVNKRIVEVSFPESAYFEKAVVFLRADCPQHDRLTDEAGVQIMELESRMNGISADSRLKMKKRLRLSYLAECVFRAAVIICAAAVICLLLN